MQARGTRIWVHIRYKCMQTPYFLLQMNLEFDFFRGHQFYISRIAARHFHQYQGAILCPQSREAWTPITCKEEYKIIGVHVLFLISIGASIRYGTLIVRFFLQVQESLVYRIPC